MPSAQGAEPLDPYASGTHVFDGIKELDGPNVNPDCYTRFYSHGHRTKHALVLLHGFTNCPQQFDALGKTFHEMGYNVLIPRYPRHGYKDRMTTAIAELRTDHLKAVATQTANAAAGVGEHVTVAGLSLGGVLAAYLAQTHDRVDRAVLIAPMFGLKGIPGPLHPVLAGLAYRLPNFYLWWDPKAKGKLPPDHGYPRLATHAYGALFQTAADVLKAARSGKPKARQLAVLTNASEPGLDNRFTYQLVEQWRRHGSDVKTFEFPVSDGLPHDLIDPANPGQNTAKVYPVVTRFIKASS